jgi:hypothetical protein
VCLQIYALNDEKEVVCVGMAIELSVWKERSLKPPGARVLSCDGEAISSAVCF